MGDFNISAGGEYDLTRTPLKSVDAAEVAKKGKLLEIFNKFDLNHDGELNSIEFARALDYFSSLDTDDGSADGILSNNEFEQGSKHLTEELGLDSKNKIKPGDIKKFIKQLMKLTEKSDHINIEQLFFFMTDDDENDEFDIQNLVNAEFDEDNSESRGGGTLGSYTLTYASGAVVKVKADKTYDIITKDQSSGKTTIASYDSNKKLVKKVITDSKNNVETINYVTITDEETQQPATVRSTKSVVYANEDTEDTEYETSYINEDGETYPVKMTQVTSRDGVPTTSITNYISGVRVSETVITADTELIYSCIESDSSLVKKIENKGSENERTTLYTYNDNNTISVNITEGDRVTTQVRAIPLGGNARTAINDEKTITYESITNGEESTTEIVYLAEGRGNARVETVTNSSGKVSITVYNENGKRDNSVVEYNGQQYVAEYDGQGNTYMVFTIDDPARISKLARSFGTTPEAIFRLNKGLVHIDQTNGAKYFVAGTKIKIPREIPADNRYLQARGSQKYETARGNQLWGDITDAVNAETASRSTSLVRVNETGNFSNFRDFALYLFAQEGNSNPNRYLVDARVNELKDMNRGLVDGQLSGKTICFKYTASKEEQVHRQNIETQRRQNEIRKQNEDRAAAPIARKIYNIIDGESHAVQDHGGEALVRDVNGSNVISVLEKYKNLNDGKSLFSHINAEWDSTSGDIYNVAAMKYLVNALVDRCRSAGINGDNVMKFYRDAFNYIDKFDMDNLNALVDKVCSQCRLLEAKTQEQTASSMQRNVSLSGATLQGLDLHANSASSTLDHFNKYEETTCGRIWEGLKWLFTLGTSDCLDEKVKADIEKFRGYITELDNALKTGGETAFRAKFKSIFVREFDVNIAREYAVKLENLENAAAIQNIKDRVDKFRNGWSFDNLSYENLTRCYKLILRKLDPANKNLEATIEQILMSKLGNNYSNATLQQKRSVLISTLHEFMNKMDVELKNCTGGKSVTQLKNELSEHSGDLFGIKHDMMNRVNAYIANQKAGDAYVSTGLKVIGMAAFGLAGGGFAMSALGTFASSMSIDIINHPEALNNPEQLWAFAKEAALDGLFSGCGTVVRDGLKAGKFVVASREVDIKKVVNITKGNASFVKTQGVLIGADSTVSVGSQIFKGGFRPENIGITVLWSAIAHVGSAKIIGGSNGQRCLRRLGKGGGKEQRQANKDFSAGQSYTGELTPEQMSAQCKQYIASVTNLGDLNAMRRFVNQLPAEYGRDNAIAIIEERTNELLANKALITVDEVSIPPETRSNALRALVQPAEHLLPDQMNDIMDYIDAVIDPNELWQVMTQLQRHGVDLTERSELRTVLDDKFAEFNQMPPYNVGEDFILYAHKSGNQNEPAVNADDITINSSNFADYPTLNMFIESQDVPITMLDTQFKSLKNDLYNAAGSLNSTEDLNAIMAQLINIPDQNQRLELKEIVQSIARMNGLTLS